MIIINLDTIIAMAIILLWTAAALIVLFGPTVIDWIKRKLKNLKR